MRHLLLLIFLILFCACSGGDDNNGEPSQTAPKINNVKIYNSHGTEDYSFNIGEYAIFGVSATDPDMDMTNLLIWQYYPADSTTPYYGPSTVALPSQSEANAIYSTIDPIEIIGPAGYWKIEFQLEDSKGNESNVFRVYASVTED